MDKEAKLVKKVKRLVRRAGCPRWLHRFGPKKYRFWQHCLALLIRSLCHLSFRRTKHFLEQMGLVCPSKSALQYTTKKMPVALWRRLLAATAGCKHNVVAIDSTGFSRTNPSYHYLKRIDGLMPTIPVKLSVLLDTRTKKFCAANIRVLPAHDIRDALLLLNQVQSAKVLVADKAYDANWLHIHCLERNLKAYIPLRRPESKVNGLSARRCAARRFRKRSYGRRQMVEAGIGAVKRKYGASVNARKARTIRSEIYCRLICHNLFFWLILRLRT
jgi:transposase